MRNSNQTPPPETKNLLKYDKERLAEIVQDLYIQLDDARASKKFIAGSAPEAWERALRKAFGEEE